MTALQLQWKTIQPTQLSHKPEARWGQSCCIINQSLYMFGGFKNSNYLNDFWKYNLAELQWQQIVVTGYIPQSRSNATLNYDPVNGRLILFGGGGFNKKRFNTINIFDQSNMNWTQNFPIPNQLQPFERTYHVAQFKSPYLIVFGGQKQELIDLIDDLWIYNMNTLAWSQIKMQPTAVKPCARHFHSSCMIDNKFYIHGGCYDKYKCLGDLFYLDISDLLETGKTQNLQWKQVMLTGQIIPRWGHTSHFYKDQIYVFGGRYIQDLNDVQIINVKTGECRNLLTTQEPQPRRRHNGGIKGSSLIFFGGFNGEYLDDLFYLNLFKNQYKEHSKQNQPINKDVTIQEIEDKQISTQNELFD